MKRTSLGLAVLTIAGLTFTVTSTATASAASADPGPETCRQGYVWREARVSDLVCVKPETRTRVAADNAVRHSRWTMGAFGPRTCVAPYVWREAFAGDDVCVTTRQRALTAKDNSLGARRKVLAKMWITRYTIGPRDHGDGTASTTSTDSIARLKLNGSHYNFGQVKVAIRWSHNDKLYWHGSVNATGHSGHAGGSFGFKTGKFDCSAPGKAPNAYAYAYDTQSGRFSARVPVRVGCKVL
ncbi:hypothetical protein ACFXJ8_14340 [Nonomuraea sp. NPDC059194]|uniref:hypothetical protein n=1 Tax=Nonomuraea sp. NPDC059194 TaxID=3346764 RepID=UPI0036B25BB1